MVEWVLLTLFVFILDGAGEFWLCLMEHIMPNKAENKNFNIKLKILVGIFNFILLLCVVISEVFVIDNAETIGRCMIFIPLIIIGSEILGRRIIIKNTNSYNINEVIAMNAIVIYKTKYGSTKTYAKWIAEELNCTIAEAKEVSAANLKDYDAIIYGGGLYAEVINGVSLITKNIEKLKDKKIAIYTTGITPTDCRDYYDKLVVEKNFKTGVPDFVKIFNFPGKMILDELTPVHRAALKTLKKIMMAKKEPTYMEKLLIELCDADGDFSDKKEIKDLINYIKE